MFFFSFLNQRICILSSGTCVLDCGEQSRKLSLFRAGRNMAVTFVTGNKNKLVEVQAILADVLPNLRSEALDCKYIISRTLTDNVFFLFN